MTDATVTAADGTPLAAHVWLAPSPAAVIALLHGIGEHGGRYRRFAAAANASGIALVTADLRGHGQSPGDRAYVDRFDDYLLDADAIVARARELAEGRPLFLMGHSMGGAIALRWLSQHGDATGDIAGVILSSAALKIGPDVPRLLVALAPLLSRLAPKLRAGAIDPGLISTQPEEVAAYRDDPLVCHQPPPARTGAELLKVIDANRRAIPALRHPLYLFHGDADRLTDPGGSRDTLAAWGSADKTLRVWPGSRHETLNDRDRDAVAGELFAWVLARCKAPT